MIDCLIIGDSIAVGAHQYRQECVSYSKGGITSHGWDKRYGTNNLTAATVIISLGTNDWEGANTYRKLREIREKIQAQRVFWISPNQQSRPQVYQDVSTIAGMFGDTVIWTNRYQKDNIHPSWAGYRELIEKTR
jgi:lysophospholipase L1-like esterase